MAKQILGDNAAGAHLDTAPKRKWNGARLCLKDQPQGVPKE